VDGGPALFLSPRPLPARRARARPSLAALGLAALVILAIATTPLTLIVGIAA
jgi:hypothetical protein